MHWVVMVTGAMAGLMKEKYRMMVGLMLQLYVCAAQSHCFFLFLVSCGVFGEI